MSWVHEGQRGFVFVFLLASKLSCPFRLPNPKAFGAESQICWEISSIISLLSLTTYIASTCKVLAGSLPAISHSSCDEQRFLILGSVSCLRCFQQLSYKNVATQHCTWQHNWHTSGSLIQVLSYCGWIPSRIERLLRIETELSRDALNPTNAAL